jgi:hypothetical protein
MSRWPAGAVSGWLLAALLGGAAGGENRADKEREADAIVEAVFRRLVQQAEPQPQETICLAVRRAVGGKGEVGDPGETLLSLLRKSHPRVRRASECGRGRNMPVTEAATGAPAVGFDIGPVEWRGEDEARVGGGFTRGGWAIREWEYEVVRQAGAWGVRKATRKLMT